jgi:pimeloyl-ACP methyl ester carboxylesterase
MNGNDALGAGQLLTVGDVQLCVQTFGDRTAPPVLLIAGAHCAMEWWFDGLCVQLAARGRFVIRYDHRDTGQSESYPVGHPGYGFDELTWDALRLLDVFGFERAHLVGISMGGGIAQRLALEAPRRVASLALLSTSPGLRPGAPLPTDLPPMAPELMQHFMTPPRPDYGDPRSVVDTVLLSQRRLTGAGRSDETLLRAVAERIVARSRSMAATQANHATLDPGPPYRARLGEVRARTLVAHGTVDPLFPLSHGEALARVIPGAELLRLEGVGHQMPPAPIWPELTAALARLSAPPDDVEIPVAASTR